MKGTHKKCSECKTDMPLGAVYPYFFGRPVNKTFWLCLWCKDKVYARYRDAFILGKKDSKPEPCSD